MKNPFAKLWSPPPAPKGYGIGRRVPDTSANIVSQIIFSWITPILLVGWTRPLQKDDLWEMDAARQASLVGSSVEDNFYRRCPPNKRPRLIRKQRGQLPETAKETAASEESTTEDYDNTPEVADPEKGGQDPVPSKRWWARSKKDSTSTKKPYYDESLVRALNDTFFWRFWSAGILKLIGDTLLTTTPLITKALLTYLGQVYAFKLYPDVAPTPPKISYGIGLAIAIFVMQQVSSFATNAFFFRAQSTGFLVRTSVISCIFRKALRLSGSSRVKHSSGQITTMISADCTRLDMSAAFAHTAWIGPLQIIIGIGLLIWNMGYSALVALGVLILGVPVQAVIVKRMIGARRGTVRITDKRVRLMQEVLQGIRLLALFGWQIPYGERIMDLRKEELVQIRRLAFYRALTFSLVFFLPVLAAVLMFITYSLSGHSLNAAIVFSSLQYLNVIRMPLVMVPLVASSLGDAYVALDRISKVLLAEEIGDDYPIDPESPFGVDMTGDFTWETVGPPSDTPKPKGKGGAGEKKMTPEEEKKKKEEEKKKKAEEKRKKTEEKAKVKRRRHGEVDEKSGVDEEEEETPDDGSPKPFVLRDVKLRVPKGKFVAIVGRVGSGKSSLLQAMAGEMRKLKGEVTFGGDVAYVSQNPWIQNLTLRENVIFGRPDSQKRFEAVVDACALRPDLAMLPSGELTEIGERGVNLSGGQKARVSLARAAYYDADVVLLDDPLSAVDSHVSKHIVEECLLSGPMASKTRILVTHQLHVLPLADYVYFLQDGRITEQGTYLDLLSQDGDFAKLIDEFGSSDNTNKDENAEKGGRARAKSVAEVGKDAKAELMQEEERAEGAVAWAIYGKYLRAAGSILWGPILLGILTISQVASVGSNITLGDWSANSIPGFSEGSYMGLYAGFGIAIALFSFVGSFAFSYAGFHASLALFRTALGSVLGSPMEFFDTTPIGRIISRLSKDIDTLDFQLPNAWYQLLIQLATVFGTVGLVIWSYDWLGLMFPPLFAVYYLCSAFYRRTSREAKRLDSLLRSLLYASYTETLTGLATVRAFREQPRFVRVTEGNIDIGNRAYFLTIVCQRWLSIRMDALGNILIFGIAIASVTFGKEANPAKLGVVLTYALSITQSFSQMVQQMAQVEQDMNTVERVLHYGDLPQEDTIKSPFEPPPSWPEKGEIEFKDVKLRYRDGLPLVLKGLSFKVRAGEHVGVVGRTGAGKTSILSALFRLVNPPYVEGSVVIDGVDVHTIALETLRHRLSIIPQDAILFDGTLRYNIDPVGLATDQEIYAALRRVGLIKSKDTFEARFNLDVQVRDDSFSAGEKQLVALCRALVKKSQIIVLDEATASVDVETDSEVQTMIQEDFKDKTLLCIAHRLNTIVFYDRIFVMDAGRVAEFDTPLALFDDRKSIFRAMCDKASLSREDILRIRKTAGQAGSSSQ